MKMRQVASAVAACIAGLFGLASFADTVVFDGTGDWPTGGDVEIPADTSITVADANVAAVAGWDTLKLNSGSRVTFANTQNAATLKANCSASGTGVVGAYNSCGLTILGDNSSMGNRAYFTFTNSVVCVSNEFGLGSSTTGQSNPLGPSVKGAVVHFGPNSSLHFGLADRKAFTNHCAITFNCDDDLTTMVFGSDAPDEYFVQDADFLHAQVHTKRKLYFRNNFQIISGRFPLRTRRGQSYYIYTVGDNVNVRISGSTVVDTAGGHATLRDGLYWLGGGTVWFEQSTSPVLDVFADSGGRINIGADGAFDNVRQMVGYYNETSLVNPARYYDLHGHDVTVGTLASAYGGAPTSTSTKFHVIRSSDPAKVTIAGYGTTSYNALHAFAILGKVSVEMADPISTNAFCTVVSDTTGDLTVSAGTLVFKWNAGWGGASGNVSVCGTGVLDVDSGNAFTDNKKNLVVSDSGKIVVRSGGMATFKSVRLGSTTLEKRVYTIEELKGDPATAPYVDGDNASVISAGTETWEGWPTQPEAETVIPLSTTVDLTDDDVANVMANVSRIVLRPGSAVNIGNATTRLALGAAISGSGTIRIVNSVGVTLLGDNSQLTAPGCFYVENSALAVSNRFGLGSAVTGAADIRFTSQDRKLVFGLADSLYCTNDVALKLGATVGGNVAWIGTESTDSHFVQNADVTFTGFTSHANRITYGGNVEFASGTFKAGGNLYIDGNLYSSFTFGPNCDVTNSGAASSSMAFYGSGWNTGMFAIPRVMFGPRSFAGFSFLHNSVSHIKFTKENVFANASNIIVQYAQTQLAQKGRSLYEVCGCDQVLGSFRPYSAISQGNSFAAVTSGAPATVTLTMPSAALVRDSLEFQGFLGYHFQGAGTNLLCNMKSTSVGGFRVSSGVAGFDWGATWGGTNIVVDGTGTLYVGADSAAAGVFGTQSGARKSAAVLTVGATGSLALESGETVVFNAARDGEPLNRGVYCSADNASAKASGAVGLDWISGEGTLRVLKGPRLGFILTFK